MSAGRKKDKEKYITLCGGIKPGHMIKKLPDPEETPATEEDGSRQVRDCGGIQPVKLDVQKIESDEE